MGKIRHRRASPLSAFAIAAEPGRAHTTVLSEIRLSCYNGPGHRAFKVDSRRRRGTFALRVDAHVASQPSVLRFKLEVR